MSKYSLFLAAAAFCGTVAFIIADSSDTTSRLVYSAAFGIAFGLMAVVFYGKSGR